MSDREAKNKIFDEIQERCLRRLDRIRAARSMRDLFAAVRMANDLMDTLELEDRRAQFGTDGGYFDLRMMGDVAEAEDAFVAAISGEPLPAARVAEAAGLSVNAVKLALYYLHKFGCVERTKTGRSFLVRLATEEIAQGAVTNNWTSIKPRRWQSTSEPIEAGFERQKPAIGGPR